MGAARDEYGLTRRRRYEILRGELELERASFIPTWRDVADYVIPRRPRFVLSDVNSGERRNQKIIDNTATVALRALAAGMMGGITSPARPWFRLTIANKELVELQNVKEWLEELQSGMSTVFLRSNLYQSLPIVFTDTPAFATSAMLVEEDFEDVLRTYVFPVGSYSIGVDARGRVNLFTRDFRMTVRQLVQKFGKRSKSGAIDWSNFSERVRSLYEQGQLGSWIDISHVVCPNEEHDPANPISKYKKFASCYFERGCPDSDSGREKFLRESGYDYFPVLCPRWGVTGEDAWGTQSPVIDSLGDIKQLQTGERKIAEAIERLLKPPMKGPSSLSNRAPSILPASFTAVDERDSQKGYAPVYQIDPRINEMEMKQEQVRGRIRRSCFEDLFLMMSYDDRAQRPTATEVAERKEEKLVALGPVLEQLNQDLLDPLIEITFMLMLRQGLVPEPPPEIQGMDIKVEYVSIMAQAQKMIGVGGLERFAGFVANLAPIVPGVAQKVDWHQMVDEHGDSMGVSPRVIRSDDAVAAIAEAEAQAQAQAAQVEQARERAATVKDLSQSDTQGDNALTEMIQGLRGEGGLTSGGYA